MNVVVLAKYVPNPTGTPELGPDNLLVREGVEGSLDPGDEPAIEAALRELESVSGELGKAVYEQAASQTAPPSGEPEAPAEKKDEDVIDAEFEVKDDK